MELKEKLDSLEQENSPASHLELGKLYAKGSFEIRDYLKALEHFKVASEGGLADASFFAGYILSQGLGIKIDLKSAQKFLSLALEQNPHHCGAMWILSEIYQKSAGSAESTSIATKLLEKSKKLQDTVYDLTKQDPSKIDEPVLTYLGSFTMQKRVTPVQSEILDAAVQTSITQGNVDALNASAFMLLTGEENAQNMRLAKEQFEKAIAQYNASALIGLGQIYLYGMGVPQDTNKVLELFRQALDLGVISAAVIIALIYHGNEQYQKNDQERLRMLKLAADYGIPQAVADLGASYYLGLNSVEKDLDKAIFFLKKACVSGVTEAMHVLANIYNEKKSGYFNRSKATALLRRAMLLGDADACTEIVDLAIAYIEGDDCPKDPKKGIALLQEAVQQDYAIAKCTLGAALIAGKGVKRNVKKGLALVKEAASQGDEDAQLILKNFYSK